MKLFLALALAGLLDLASGCTNVEPVIVCFPDPMCGGEPITLPRGASIQDCFTGPPPDAAIRRLQALPDCFGAGGDFDTLGGGPGASCFCKEDPSGPDLCATPIGRPNPKTLTVKIQEPGKPDRIKPLPLECNIWTGGEPHIKTWNGTWYDWHGECDAVMLDAPDYMDGEGLLMHVRTKIRFDYSYIESAAIKIGDDIMEVSGYGEYFINGVNQADMPASVSNHFVTHTATNKIEHRYSIDLGKGVELEVKTHKDIVSFGLNFAPTEDVEDFIHWFSSSRGLMGNFVTGQLLARDGVTLMSNPNDLGQEWQVQDSEPKLFQDLSREPQFPNKCLLPSPTAAQARRRLGESVEREAAEKACAEWQTEDAKERCIYDVMATGDLSMAVAGSY